MWASILTMIIIFYNINKKAALLQIPYLLWVSFASVLNGSIWFLN
jgi:tryptophan-rich sensory protein